MVAARHELFCGVTLDAFRTVKAALSRPPRSWVVCFIWKLRWRQKECGCPDCIKRKHGDVRSPVENRDVEWNGRRRETEEHHKSHEAGQGYCSTWLSPCGHDASCEPQ